MNELKRAEIHWLSAEEGGRKQLPTKTTYYAVADFPNQDNAWSVVLEFDLPPSTANSSRICEGYVSFLMEYAPTHLLASGSDFFISEGPKKVARVLVC